MTRQEIYDRIFAIARKEVESQGYRFSAETESQMKEFIRYGVFSNMNSADINNGSKIAEAERNMRVICRDMCHRERQRQHYHTIEKRTFTEMRFQICPRYPFC